MLIDGRTGLRDYTFEIVETHTHHHIRITPSNIGSLPRHNVDPPWLEEHAHEDLVYQKALTWYYENAQYGPIHRVSLWDHLLEA